MIKMPASTRTHGNQCNNGDADQSFGAKQHQNHTEGGNGNERPFGHMLKAMLKAKIKKQLNGKAQANPEQQQAGHPMELCPKVGDGLIMRRVEVA